ncbi:beta-lactamase/transpeptidase-like protein [Nemania abortiva]|nr:beta-lactamase/transpeptidase-like protein [Nemania abortiva]
MSSADDKPGRLERTAAQIEQTRALFGASSFAIGISCKGERAFKAYGYANRGAQRVPDENTIYMMGSCTKAFTSTMLTRFASKGQIDLDAPVSSTLPGLDTKSNSDVSKKMTARDMLSHNSGLNQLAYTVQGKGEEVFQKHEDIMNVFNHLPKVAEFRSEWRYNNWLFALAGVVLVHISGKSVGACAKDEIFSELGMNRSSFTYPTDENYAVPYQIFDDKPPRPLPLPAFGDGDAFDSSGSSRSCVRDMLTWAGALMLAWNARSPGTEGRPSPWARDLQTAMAEIQKPYFTLANDPKQAYAMGLYTYHLPTREINTVTNGDLNTVPYVLGRESTERLMIGHTGDYGGFLSAYWTFPQDEIAVVVLCNSFEINGDPTNIVAQIIMQEIFDLKPRIDLVNVAETVVLNAKARWTTLVNDWTRNRQLGTKPRPAQSYVGAFTNTGLSMTLHISFTCENASGGGDEAMILSINGLEAQTFQLYHYHHNSWSFLPKSRDDCISQGYTAYISDWKCFVVDFSAFAEGRFDELSWVLDSDPRVTPTVFKRVD